MRSRQIGPEIVREAAGDLSMDSRPAKPQATSARVPNPQPPQRQVAHAPAPSIKSTSLSSWMNGLLSHQRVLQTSLLALLLLGLAVYLGTRAGAGTVEKEQANEASSTYVPASAGQKHTSEARVPTAYDELQPTSLRQSDERQDSSNVFTYVVQPNDTLRALCLSLVGRYDETVQKEIRKLNPNLKDLVNLKAGQEIRLPLAPSKPGQDHLKNTR